MVIYLKQKQKYLKNTLGTLTNLTTSMMSLSYLHQNSILYT